MAQEASLPLATADLVWQVVRSNSSFLRAGRTDNGVIFNAESHNLVNLNRKKYSGLGNAKTVGVTIRRSGRKGGILSIGNTQSATPAKANQKTGLRLHNARSFNIARSKLQAHRPTLEKVTLVRIAKISKAERSTLKAAPKKE